MMANLERGEIEVDLDGAPHVLTPSYEAQVAIERQTGRSIEQLAQAAGDGGLTIEQAAIVVTECVRAHGRAKGLPGLSGYSPQRVGECIVETGKLQVAKRLELLLFLAITGGYTAQGEVRTRPSTTTPAGSPATAA
jgi:hypothetical protein